MRLSVYRYHLAVALRMERMSPPIGAITTGHDSGSPSNDVRRSISRTSTRMSWRMGIGRRIVTLFDYRDERLRERFGGA